MDRVPSAAELIPLKLQSPQGGYGAVMAAILPERNLMMKRWNTDLTTHTGLTFLVRPARPDDEAALHDFFENVTPEDLRFRFLSTVKEVGHDRLVAMTRVDHRQNESFLAFEHENGPIIGAAMLACDEKLDTGEVAVSISRDHKNRGIGWELLGHVTRYAEG